LKDRRFLWTQISFNKLSLVFTGWGVAGLIAPSLGGLLVDLTGGYEIPLTIFSIFSLIGVLICIFLKKRLKLYLE